MPTDSAWDLIGAPSSAGAYAPGQEKAPAALRAAGLLDRLHALGIDAADRGDVRGFRWRPDPENARAMNASVVRRVALDIQGMVHASIAAQRKVLVLGGDCTVELGSVAGVLHEVDSLGLIYFDMDTDLNTPSSIRDGALDWMGVSHLLGVDDAVDDLIGLGPKIPMLSPHQVYFYGAGNFTPFERQVIEDLEISMTSYEAVSADPVGSASSVRAWAQAHQALLLHLDADALDFARLPLAEHTRRNVGLSFDALMSSLQELLRIPGVVGLTITEVNPDHGLEDGSTLRQFATGLAEAMAGTYRG